MTQLEQVTAMRQFGYSPSEARFISATILHSSYFVRRQINGSGPKGGNAAHRLCLKVLEYGHAKRERLAGNTDLYHLRNRRLYSALNHPEFGCYPKKGSAIRPRLMGLDYVLENQSYRFLSSEESKLSYFTEERGLPVSILPFRTLPDNRERLYFPEHFPIRIDPETNEVAFVYIDGGVSLGPTLLTWMGHYKDLIESIGNVGIVYVSALNGRFERAAQQFKRTFPGSAGALSEGLIRYFHQRLEIETKPLNDKTPAQIDEYRTRQKRYKDPRFEQHYEPWKAGAITVKREQPITFATYHLAHDYKFLASGLNLVDQKSPVFVSP